MQKKGECVSGKLESDSALKSALNVAMASSAASKGAQDWFARLVAFFSEVKAGIPSKLDEQHYLLRLWDENPVSATGNGTVKMAPALSDAAFRKWFAERVTAPLPVDDMEAEAALIKFYDELSERLKALCGRTPRLKINRVLCAVFPEHFTSLADVGVLLKLHEEMGGNTKDHPVQAHKAIRTRIDAALGPAAEGDVQEKVRRVCLPWLLFERIDSESTPADKDQQELTAPTGLKPLPAKLRRKGLTAMKGGFQTLLSFMEDLREGVTREEFAGLMKQANPDLSPSSLGTAINVVAREFDLCRREGDTYRLSARGLNLLQTLDQNELADHLLTKVLGVDNLLKHLEATPASKPELVEFLQEVNPGWTSDFAPTSLIGWMVSLELVELNDHKQYVLTERGHEWASRVTWTPQSLPKSADTAVTKLVTSTVGALQVPSQADVTKRVQDLSEKRLRFDPKLIAQLHAGLWSQPVRHFAVLTGISGSGKTQLALNYALALTDSKQADSAFVKVIPVQPGWYDPSPLLGYVNPIQDNSYRSAPFWTCCCALPMTHSTSTSPSWTK